MHYSTSTKGFYGDLADYPNLPEDLVEVSQEDHDALFEAQSQGKIIVPDENGYPIAIDRPALTGEAAAANVRARRDNLMKGFEWRYTRHDREARQGITATDDIATLDSYMKALADVTDQAGFPTSITWPVEP